MGGGWEIPFGKLRAGSRPAGENAGLRNDAGIMGWRRDSAAGECKCFPHSVVAGRFLVPLERTRDFGMTPRISGRFYLDGAAGFRCNLCTPPIKNRMRATAKRSTVSVAVAR
jgi:hypothetical protein